MRGRFAAACLGLALGLAACAPQPGRSDSQPQEELIVVGMSQVGAESDWRVANTESMLAVFQEENGYRLLFEDARQRQDNQIASIRKFIQQQVDYIVLMPIQETGWDSVLQEAKEAKIPVILVDRTVQVEDEELYAVHIGSDFAREGQLAVDWLKEYLDQRRQAAEEAQPSEQIPSEAAAAEPQPVQVVHLQGTLGSTAQLGRTAALEQAVQEEGWNLLAQLDGGFTRAKAYEEMREFLAQSPAGTPIDVVYCENDNEAFGAIQALEEAGYRCDAQTGVIVVSFDATRHALELCLEGKIALAVECNPLLGPLTEQAIRQLEAGEPLQRHQYVEEGYFTPQTVTPQLIQERPY